MIPVFDGETSLQAQLEQVVDAHAGSFDAGHDVSHLRRVALSMVQIDPKLESREILAAAFLHDVVNLPKNHPQRSSAALRSAEVAREALAQLGFPPTSIDRVAEAIEDHSYSRGRVPRSDLGRALQDADRLEALGAIGLMRTFSTGAHMGAAYFHSEDPWAVGRDHDDLAFSIDHFATKLLGLHATMQTERGRDEARRRTELLEMFLQALGRELGVPWPGGASGAVQKRDAK